MVQRRQHAGRPPRWVGGLELGALLVRVRELLRDRWHTLALCSISGAPVNRPCGVGLCQRLADSSFGHDGGFEGRVRLHNESRGITITHATACPVHDNESHDHDNEGSGKYNNQDGRYTIVRCGRDARTVHVRIDLGREHPYLEHGLGRGAL